MKIMERINSSTCKACGMNSLEKVYSNHVKCPYCDSIYLIDDDTTTIKIKSVQTSQSHDNDLKLENYNDDYKLKDNILNKIRKTTLIRLIIFILLCFITGSTGNRVYAIFGIILLITLPSTIRKIKRDYGWYYIESNKRIYK